MFEECCKWKWILLKTPRFSLLKPHSFNFISHGTNSGTIFRFIKSISFNLQWSIRIKDFDEFSLRLSSKKWWDPLHLDFSSLVDRSLTHWIKVKGTTCSSDLLEQALLLFSCLENSTGEKTKECKFMCHSHFPIFLLSIRAQWGFVVPLMHVYLH